MVALMHNRHIIKQRPIRIRSLWSTSLFTAALRSFFPWLQRTILSCTAPETHCRASSMQLR